MNNTTENVQKTWLITGASSGIGRQVTTQLLSQGGRVIALVRKPEKMTALVADYPEQLTILACDLSELNQVSATIESVFERFSNIDVILNAAGYALVGAVEELPETAILEQLAVNLMAPILIARAALPFLRQKGSGHIIHMSSEGGQISYPTASIYHASKWGGEGFFEALALEVRALGIGITLVEPGRIKTEFNNNAVVFPPLISDYSLTTVGNYFRLLAMGRFPTIGDPEKVAQAIISLTMLKNPPMRLVLGSDSYRNIKRALDARLIDLHSQEQKSSLTDLSRP